MHSIFFLLIFITAGIRIWVYTITKDIELKESFKYEKEIDKLLIALHFFFYFMVYVETYIEYKELNIISGIGAIIYAIAIALLLSIGRSPDLIQRYSQFLRFPFLKRQSNREYLVLKSFYIIEIIGLGMLFQSFKSLLVIFPFYIGLIIFRVFLVEKVFED